MKGILFLLLLTLYVSGHSQNTTELKLQPVVETHLGLWQKGDYKIYIEMDRLEGSFRNAGTTLLAAASDKSYPDSLSALRKLASARYLSAADQLKNAPYGFDLRSLIVYHGPENKKDDLGNSPQVEKFVRMLLDGGMAVVYYKGARVTTLKMFYEPQDKGLIEVATVVVYFDDVANYIFRYQKFDEW